MNCVLLGGSNSILRNSVRLGLSDNFNVTNYALGATSCVQNLMELVRNKQEIENCDFIVTESNVNDIMSLSSMKIKNEYIEYLINEYYRLLHNTGKPIFVIILPTHPRQETAENIDFINDIHKKNCIKYRFEYIQFEKIMSRLNNEQVDMLLPHPRHFNEAFIYQMMMNLSIYIKNKFSRQLSYTTVSDIIFRSKNENKVDGSKYFYIDASSMDGAGCVEVKSNSSFSANLINITKKIKFGNDLFGMKIIAISAWCDGYSSMKISDDNATKVKNFVHHYTCSEFVEPILITESTEIMKNSDNLKPTEHTVLTKYLPNENVGDLKIEGFLINSTPTNQNQNLSQRWSGKNLDISELVMPRWEPFAAAIKSFITYSKTD